MILIILFCIFGLVFVSLFSAIGGSIGGIIRHLTGDEIGNSGIKVNWPFFGLAHWIFGFIAGIAGGYIYLALVNLIPDRLFADKSDPSLEDWVVIVISLILAIPVSLISSQASNRFLVREILDIVGPKNQKQFIKIFGVMFFVGLSVFVLMWSIGGDGIGNLAASMLVGIVVWIVSGVGLGILVTRRN